MIRFEHTDVVGWKHAIRGMRNALNSWKNSDSRSSNSNDEDIYEDYSEHIRIGPNDYDLMKRLRNAGTDHRKFMRMIVVYVDIIAPLYIWKQIDTYKVGTVANSCSTMHKIHAKEFNLEDFSTDHMLPGSYYDYNNMIIILNIWRDIYLNGGKITVSDDGDVEEFAPKDKRAWMQMIQLLPSSYNQRRTVMFNYEVLANIYKSRKNHKLDEWHTFCSWIETLPYSEFITGEGFITEE